MAKSSRKKDPLQEDPSEPEAAQEDLSEPEAAQAESSAPDAAQEDILEPAGHQDGNPLAAAFQKLREGRGREAADLYHDIVKPTETPLVAHVSRGKRHDEHGRHELAIGEFLAAEDVDRVDEAILAFRKGLYAAAEAQLKAICKRNPSHGPAHFYRGEALHRLGRVDEALQTMERAIELQPRNWRAYHTLGMLFDRKDERERASEMYRQARELNRL